jgi:predicted PurR-regulated permease PerM
MTPVAFALFIIALVWPLQRRLRGILPQVIAVLLTAFAALFAIGCGGWLVVWGFGGIAQWVIANAARLQGLYMHAADLLEQRGLYAAELFAQQINVLWLVQVLRAISGRLEVEPLGHRLRQVGSEGAIDTAGEIAGRLQTYMLVRFGMSALTGLVFWAFTAVDGSSCNGNGG